MLQRENDEEFRDRIRRFEKTLWDNLEKLNCPVHLSLGHEDVAVALRRCLVKEDWMFSTHRNHHHYFAKGGNEGALWDEIMGLESGLNGGFCGSQAIIDPSINFHASAIVGGLIGVAVGCAVAIKGTGAIAVCCIGDASTEQGVFWEALNFSALHNLPIAFICENNGMSVDSPIEERQFENIPHRVGAFGIDISDSVMSCIESARHGTPSFYEAKVNLECDHMNLSVMRPLRALT